MMSVIHVFTTRDASSNFDTSSSEGNMSGVPNAKNGTRRQLHSEDIQ